MDSPTRDTIQEMKMHNRMKATRLQRAFSFKEDTREAEVRASKKAMGNVNDLAEKFTNLLSRVSGATHTLEMRVSRDAGHLDAIAQQECLEKVWDSVEKNELTQTELIGQVLAHIDHLAGRLEAIAKEAGECDARLYCNCILSPEARRPDLDVEDVLSGGRTIREYLSDHMRRAAAADPECQASNPQETEQAAMMNAHSRMGGDFLWVIPLPPHTVKEFTEMWVDMWSSELFRKGLNATLVERKERAREKLRSKKVRHEKKWRELLKKGLEAGTPTRPAFQTFRSWASDRA